MDILSNEVTRFMDDLIHEDNELEAYYNEYGPLSDYFTDYDYLKSLNDLTQKDIAEKLETKQSAVSRLESSKSNPSYKTLKKLTDAVGGNLLITPRGDMTVSVPYDLEEMVNEKSRAMQISVHDYLSQILKKGIKENIIYEPGVLHFSEDLDASTCSKVNSKPVYVNPNDVRFTSEQFDFMAC